LSRAQSVLNKTDHGEAAKREKTKTELSITEKESMITVTIGSLCFRSVFCFSLYLCVSAAVFV